MTGRRKTAKDENFPVAFRLFPARLRKMVNLYYAFAREADDIADNAEMTPAQKLSRLKEVADSLYGTSTTVRNAVCLREMFLQEGFDFSLAGDLLRAFEQDARGFDYQTWGQLAEYCRCSAAPVGRFLLALYDENPSTYLPAEALCAALQIVNHVQDIRYDACVLERVYLPAEILRQYGCRPEDLSAPEMSPGLRLAVDDVLARCEGLLKDARQLPKILKSKVLRIEVFVIIYLTRCLIYKLKRRDVLREDVRLSARDKITSLGKGIVRGLWLRPNIERTKYGIR